ncbi:MAG: exoribonuclease II [Deltaproteobacteria bacterium CG23_combo_of_CG06-09_8_20_14_all_60_8]|nr:MAG: exoribonuclease II [Deltaproteobacteria bacterium CG23_combo_of_CG06-09_8_20_14_all_60_8]
MGLQGKIIEYVDNGKFLCAYVQEEAGNRLRLLNQNSREVSLPQARVVHENLKPVAGLAREQLLNLLKETAEHRLALMAEVRLQEIWELVSTENDTDFPPVFLAELSFGAGTGDDQVAALLRCVFVDRLFFKYRDGRIVVHSEAVVEELRGRQEKARENENFLEDSGRALALLMAGQEAGDWPGRDRCLELVEDFCLRGGEATEGALAREVLKKAGLTRPHDPYWVLVRAGIWQPDENIGLRRYEVPVAFSDEARAWTRQLTEPSTEALLAEGRRDLRALDLFTIDGPQTRDYDDALHLEAQGGNFLVGIHIADVARFVAPGDPLFEAARRRGTSLYFADAQVPMLPPEISEGLCSLMVNQDRAALSILVTLSPDAEVLDFSMVPSVVRVKTRRTYGEVDQVADSDPVIRTMLRLAGRLQERRIRAGALVLPVPDVNISLDRAGAIKVNLAPVDTPGRCLVAEFMVLANSLGAQYLADREVVGLFRCQDQPKRLLVQGKGADFFLTYRQRKYLSPGRLVTTPQPHSGVGVMQYTTLTSPIRRLLDLVMQHQLSALLRGQGQLFSQRELEEIAGIIQSLQTRANLVGQLRHRYWLLKYLEGKVGSRLAALVLERGPNRVKVVLVDLLLESELPARPAMRLEPGATVQVLVARVDPLDNLLRLEW